jgi:hypothetical protein
MHSNHPQRQPTRQAVLTNTRDLTHAPARRLPLARPSAAPGSLEKQLVRAGGQLLGSCLTEGPCLLQHLLFQLPLPTASRQGRRRRRRCRRRPAGRAAAR